MSFSVNSALSFFTSCLKAMLLFAFAFAQYKYFKGTDPGEAIQIADSIQESFIKLNLDLAKAKISNELCRHSM